MKKLLLLLLLLSASALLLGQQADSAAAASATNAAADKTTPKTLTVPTTQPDGRKYLSVSAQPGKQSGAEKLADCKKRVSAFKDKPCDIIFIGDSITQLWQDSKKGGLPIWTKIYEPRHALDFGIGGDSIQNVLWRLENMDIKSFKPKVAVIMIGTNNRSNTPREIADGVKAVIAKTQEAFAGVKIILVSILPSNRVSGGAEALAMNDRMMAADKIIRDYADDKSVYWLDLVPLMPQVKTTAPDGKDVLSFKGLSSDRIHPDGTGYQIWADAMEPLLTKLLAEKR